jgi:hypothetical protein
MPPEPFTLPFTYDVEGCSRAGAEKAVPKAGSQLSRVYEALQVQPMTDRQLVQVTGLPINVVNARRWWLVKGGLVESKGTVDGIYGVQNTVWGVTA